MRRQGKVSKGSNFRVCLPEIQMVVIVNTDVKIPTGKIVKPVRDVLEEGLGQQASWQHRRRQQMVYVLLAHTQSLNPVGSGESWLSCSPGPQVYGDNS